ncbi:MAG: GHKL domain-containing protein, partial [Lachnospiraceae bacterium]|nr:GHKL domain-containing protein [Lachnospiraceae bacterium]
ISNVSHDFRSPLTSIKGYTEAMMDGTIPVEMHDRYLGIIANETERLEKLTKSILELNTMDAGKLALNYSDFDINGMLKKTAAFFEGTCRKKKITLDLVLTGTNLTVHGDKEKIEQVIYNLLDNAIKFSERNSFIHIETTLRQKKCYVSIKDEGCGISRENLPKIWDRFYKSDASRGRDRTGTGLGLSIVKEIITAHGQTISVVSTENVGTEFVFSLEAVV